MDIFISILYEEINESHMDIVERRGDKSLTSLFLSLFSFIFYRQLSWVGTINKIVLEQKRISKN